MNDAMSDATEVAETEDVSIEAEASPSVEDTPTEVSDAVSDEAEAEVQEFDPEAMQRKIAKQAFKERELRREIREMKKAFEESRPTPKEPKMEDFETLDEFIDAKFAHKMNQPQSKPEPGADPELAEKIDELHELGSEKYGDEFSELVDAVNLTDVMSDAVLDSDIKEDLAMHLAKHPKEVNRIAKLPPSRQAAELGKIEFKLTQKPTKPIQQSKAPRPIDPVAGKETQTNEHKPGDDMATFIRKRNQELGRG